LKPGLGAGLSAGIVPESLQSVYGNRLNIGFAAFVTLRPGETKNESGDGIAVECSTWVRSRTDQQHEN